MGRDEAQGSARKLKCGTSRRSHPLEAAVTSADLDRVQHEIDMLAERSLLFVACTRAREDLHVSWHGTPSPFLPTGLPTA